MFSWAETFGRLERAGCWYLTKIGRPRKAVCPECWLAWMQIWKTRDDEVADSDLVWATPADEGQRRVTDSASADRSFMRPEGSKPRGGGD
jgi:hypothetical protein